MILAHATKTEFSPYHRNTTHTTYVPRYHFEYLSAYNSPRSLKLASITLCCLFYVLMYFYCCLFDNHQWPCNKVEGTSSLPLGQFTGRNRKMLQAQYVWVCLVYETWGHYTCDSVHLCIPITTTTAGHLLNSLIFHDDIKCITANGQMMIYVGTN